MKPKSEAELSEAIRAADGPLQVRGGGTRPIGRPVDGAVLETGGLSGIVEYEPGALTLVVRAGTPMAEIEAALAAEDQMLAFEPMDHRALLGTEGEPTIGGVVAGNVSGPRRVGHAGACRDSLLGVRFVDGTGRLVKNGGRVMKNVTGYDLTKLMAGSHGTLGVLSEVSLKVLPRPEAQATLVLRSGIGSAFDAMTRAITSPFEVSGAAWLPDEGGRVFLRLEGFSESVAYRAGRVSALLSDLGEVETIDSVVASAALWRDLCDVRALEGCETVWRVSAAPSALWSGFYRALDQSARFLAQFDWAGGLAWFGMSAADAAVSADLLGSPGTELPAAHVHRMMQATVADHSVVPGGGHVTLIKGPVELRKAVSPFQPEPAPVAALSAGLRAKFDPHGILNPGLMD